MKISEADRQTISILTPNPAVAKKAEELLEQGRAIGPEQAAMFARNGRGNNSNWREDGMTGNWREKDWRNQY